MDNAVALVQAYLRINGEAMAKTNPVLGITKTFLYASRP
jgi:hypothetical protein